MRMRTAAIRKATVSLRVAATRRKNYFPIRKITVFPQTDSQSRKNHFPANGNQLQKNYIMMDADANGGHSQSNSFPASGSHSRKNQNRFPNERQPFVGNL